MGRGLVSLGAFLVVATVAYWVSDAVGLIPTQSHDTWSPLLVKAGLVLIAAGVALRVLNPARARIAKGRCATCGRVTAAGHLYCMDHLQASVNAWRDQTRAGMTGRSKGRHP